MSPLSASLLWSTLCCLELSKPWSYWDPFLAYGKMPGKQGSCAYWLENPLCFSVSHSAPTRHRLHMQQQGQNNVCASKNSSCISPLGAQPPFSDACKAHFIEQVCYKSSPCMRCAPILASQDCRQQAWSWIQDFWHRREYLSGCCTQPNKPYINYVLSCSNRKKNNRAIGQVKYSHMPQNSPWYILNTRNSRYIAAVRVTCW